MEAVMDKPTTGAQTGTQRYIRKDVVLGSGVMGSRIACHFANIGVEVLLLDIVPRDLPEDKKDSKADCHNGWGQNPADLGLHTRCRFFALFLLTCQYFFF